MKIRNLTAKPIGFGSVILLPDQKGDTPKGYGPEHPTVKYYLSRGWIETVGEVKKNSKTADNPANVQIGMSATDNSGEPNPDTPDGDVDSASEKPDSSGPKSLERMHKEDLQTLAAEIGVEVAETDTKQNIIVRPDRSLLKVA